jgi:hypothetical protein
LVPFTFHWYVGAEPGFVGVAVKVIAVPGQLFARLETILTAAVIPPAPTTAVVIVFEVAVVGLAQAEFDVSTQVT